MGELAVETDAFEIIYNINRYMRKILAMAVAVIAVTACTTQQKAEPEKTAAQQLLERLDTLRQKGIMYGHQDDPM